MKCPNCGAMAKNVGRKFKCPKQDDEQTWALTLSLFNKGHF